VREAQELLALAPYKEMTDRLQQSLALVHLLLVEGEAREALGPQILTGMMAVVAVAAVTPITAQEQGAQELQDKEMTEATVVLLAPNMVEAVEAVPVRQAKTVGAQKEATAAQEQTHIRRGLQQRLLGMEDFTVAAAVEQDTKALQAKVSAAQVVVGKAVLTLL
jgi:hypothetical protein